MAFMSYGVISNIVTVNKPRTLLHIYLCHSWPTVFVKTIGDGFICVQQHLIRLTDQFFSKSIILIY